MQTVNPGAQSHVVGRWAAATLVVLLGVVGSTMALAWSPNAFDLVQPAAADDEGGDDDAGGDDDDVAGDDDGTGQVPAAGGDDDADDSGQVPSGGVDTGAGSAAEVVSARDAAVTDDGSGSTLPVVVGLLAAGAVGAVGVRHLVQSRLAARRG